MNMISTFKAMMVIGLLALPTLGTYSADQDYNPDLLIFAGELRLYTQKAVELSQLSDDKKESKEKRVQELQSTGKRLGRVYFSETAEVIQNELNKHLSLALKENKSLKNYFVFLGNAFSEEALKLIKSYQDHQKKIRTYSLMGGTAIGLVLGGGYLVIRTRHTITTATLSLKDYAIASGAVLGAAAIGLGVGTMYSAKLPMDHSIQNAKDFEARFPHGEDFINKLDPFSPDLALLRSEMNSN